MKHPYEIWHLIVEKDEEEYGLQNHTASLILHVPTGRLYCNCPELLVEARAYPRAHNITNVMVNRVMRLSYAAWYVLEQRMERVPILLNEYDRVQRYGGPEEGGWYYYNEIHASTTRIWETSGAMETSDLDRYGEGKVLRAEIIRAQSENKEKAFYS